MHEDFYELMRAGDHAAERRLREFLGRRLRARLERRFGRQLAPWQIEDAAFDAFQALLQKCEKIPSWRAAMRYLVRAADSGSLKQLRRPPNARLSEVDPDRERVSSPSGRFQIEPEAVRTELIDELEWLLRRVTPAEARVVLAEILLGLQKGRRPSIDAIAETAGLTPWKVRQARRRLGELGDRMR